MALQTMLENLCMCTVGRLVFTGEDSAYAALYQVTVKLCNGALRLLDKMVPEKLSGVCLHQSLPYNGFSRKCLVFSTIWQIMTDKLGMDLFVS